MPLYYVKNDEQVSGPFDTAQIKEMYKSGNLSAIVSASLNGEDGWFPIHAILERHQSGVAQRVGFVVKEIVIVLAAVMLFAIVAVIIKMLWEY